MTFLQKLEETARQSNSTLCVGLDPNLNRIPVHLKEKHTDAGTRIVQFLKQVIDVTAAHCAAYKPNLGFFEALGASGLQVFEKVIDYIPDDKIIIADAKRGDISSTAEHYAEAYFNQFDVDAITLNPLMGFETLDPFLNHPGKAVFVLTLTSNPGAEDFLKKPFGEHNTMAEYISAKLATYDEKHATHIGMVVGATQARQLSAVVRHHHKGALLIPGVGTQGGSIKELISALENHEGIPLVNSSRSILYAGQNSSNWKKAVGNKASEFKTALQPLTQRYV